MAAGVRACGDVVPGRWLVGGEKDVGGLAGAKHDDRGGEGFEVGGVGSDHRELAVGLGRR